MENKKQKEQMKMLEDESEKLSYLRKSTIKWSHLKILWDMKNRLRSYGSHLIWNLLRRNRGNEENQCFMK